jgi:peptidoglycan hydrolase CwlO-like protein
MFSWLKLLFKDPNGDSNEAIEEFRRERSRSNGVKSELAKVTERLKQSREAVQAKARAIQTEGEERVSKEGLQPTQESSG